MTASPKSRILIVGGGALGAMTGYNLEKSNQARITFILRSNFPAVTHSGFTIDSISHGHVTGWLPLGGVLNAVPDQDPDRPFDYILCCTKNIPDVPPRLEDIIRRAVTPGVSAIVLLQNGLNIEKPIMRSFPANPVLSGVSMIGAEELEPGKILHNDEDRILVGPFPPVFGVDKPELVQQKMGSAAAARLVALYASTGHATATFDANVPLTRWKKLLYNAVWNPICALTDLDTGRVRLESVFSSSSSNTYSSHSPLGSSAPRKKETEMTIFAFLVLPAMREICAAAKAAAGVELTEEHVAQMAETDQIDSFLLPSMLQDVQKGRFVECENLLGEAVREGHKNGVKMPVVRTLYCLCRGVQFRTRERRGEVDVKALVKEFKRYTAEKEGHDVLEE